jgi:hypothetical protein
MSFYVHTDGVTHVAGPFPDYSGAVERAVSTCRMRASRGDQHTTGTIVEALAGMLGPVRVTDVGTFRYLGGPFESVEVTRLTGDRGVVKYDKDGATT